MIKCPVCKRDFKNGRALAAHRRWHCSTVFDPNDRPKRPCTCLDGGDWEILTMKVPGSEDYIGKINPDTGKKYRKYCTVCMEVV